MIGSSRIEIYSLEDGLGIVSCNPIVSKDPCWSNFFLSGGGGSSRSNGGRPKSLCDRKNS
jgi:hypothetical protein